MSTLEQTQLAQVFAFLQTSIEYSQNQKTSGFKERLEEQQPIWEKYLSEQADHIRESIQAFKYYDTKGKLHNLWSRLKYKLRYPRGKTFDLLSDYATQAFESGDTKRALLMYSFIALLYPNFHRVHMRIGELTETVYGIESALNFYQSITPIFEEPELLFVAAQCAMQADQFDQAKIYVTKALEIFEKRPPTTPHEIEFKADLTQLLKLIDQACA